MVNKDLIIKKINDSGLKKGYIAKKMGLSTSGLSKKINQGRFDTDEAIAFCRLTNIRTSAELCAIFFAKDVDNNGNIVGKNENLLEVR